MLRAAQRAQLFAEGKTRESLEENDELLGFAIVRAIEVVGEAASKVTLETRRDLTEIPWHNIIGMRNRIVHDYLNVDYDVVWAVVTKNLPPLVEQLETIVDD
jgi:uncharacterized protein with HEPN domain